ncbi:MAG: hypothetical protein TREMPRED_004949, partial [Tremellales sp. Tagirdzhanova-0007]
MPKKATHGQRQQLYANLGRVAQHSTTLALANPYPPASPHSVSPPGPHLFGAQARGKPSRPVAYSASCASTSSTIRDAVWSDDGNSEYSPM